MKPVNGHLLLKQDKNAFRHLIATVAQPRYWLAFAVTTLLATGGYSGGSSDKLDRSIARVGAEPLADARQGS